ncbi:MAG: heparinase II/III family protein, partial [Planctomycetia bacterium]
MKLQTFIAILRQFGLKNCLFRVGYQRRKKKGHFERVNPTFDWDDLFAEAIFRSGEGPDDQSLRSYLRENTGRFFFPLGQPVRLPDGLADGWQQDPVMHADDLEQGFFGYFFDHSGKLGEPGPEGPKVDWFLNPITGQRDTQMVHWSRRGDFDPDRGDIKYIWEPSRFAWVYDLVRAYVATDDDRYPKLFWHLLNSWMQANPPTIGPGWQCGQEAAIRVMAVCFGLWAFFDHPATTEENLLAALRLLATLGNRIEVNIDYAKSQRSNHSSTEALGLVMLGLLFPTMNGADRWCRIGRKTLEHDAKRHFWSDGSYLMHSFNYQRMTMHCFLWAMRLAELAHAPFSEQAYAAMARSTRFLEQQLDASGRMPNYGSNDGALISPLCSGDYLDYRPLLGAMRHLIAREEPTGEQ